MRHINRLFCAICLLYANVQQFSFAQNLAQLEKEISNFCRITLGNDRIIQMVK